MRKRDGGFTLVEVMVSLGVMTIGAMALLAMQQQTTRANVHAREITTATQIAQTWIERFKIDAMRWVSTTPSEMLDLQNTLYLSGIVANDGVFTGIPVQANDTVFGGVWMNAFDYLGNEVPSVNHASTRFCVSHRLSWVFPRQTMRADVRVFWPRDRLGAAGKTTANDILVDFPNCADDNASLNPGGDEFDNYHVVYLSTTLRPVNF